MLELRSESCQCILQILCLFHFFMILSIGAECLAALSPVAFAITESYLATMLCGEASVIHSWARCLHVGIEKNEKRFSWFMRCLMCLAQTRPPVQHDGRCRHQGWGPSHFNMSVFIRKSAIELPLLHISSQQVCGLQEWKQKGAQASLNNYFFEAHEPA